MIKKFLRNLIKGEKANSKTFVSYLRKQGVTIGENVNFYSPSNTLVDTSAPWLLTIGNNVNITHGVIILTHDYSWSVIKQLPDCKGRISGAQEAVNIGNNVFIGMNAIITRGVTIGDNVVIGAGSIVTKDCESNSVYAGNPAKRIMSIEEYAQKRNKKQFSEAKMMAITYKNKFHVNPPVEVFFEYFNLFSSVEEALKIPRFVSQLKTGGNYDESVAYMNSNARMFENYEDFLATCFGRENADID